MDNILFFDGVCVMCNGLVDFIMRHDQREVFKFAPLQGNTAKRLIPQYVDHINTVVLMDEKGLHTESDAIIRVFSKLGGIYRLVLLLKILPKPLRDRVYSYVSHNRYRWFGKRDQCRLPSPNENSRILD
ncbi:MAG TPA: DCC1-like thiol-disulfide oxidoreductase family protein [Myxococcota bacterium]|nr:DCC1-like thiol-disulfide oxidoreductase family protein [Myxococcota bacterium]